MRTGIATTDAGTYSLTGLLRNGSYDLQVRAVNDAGPGPWSDSFTQGVEEEAPLVPKAPTLSPRARELAAIWTPNPIDGGSDRYNYDLRYIGSDATDKDDDDNWTVVAGAWRPSRPIRYTISGLTDGVSYDVQMRAINLVGTTAWSAASVGTPGPQNTDAAFPPDIDTARTVAENTPPGQKIGEPFTATDIDGDQLTYRLDDPGSPFDIEPTTGQLLTKAPLNHEDTSTYLVLVLVSDDKDENDDHDPVSDDRLGANITIEDVNEAPVVMGLPDAGADDAPVRGLLPAQGHRGGARRGRPRARWSLRAREQGQRSQRPRHPCEPPPACDRCGVAALPRRLRAGGRHRRQDSAKPLPRDPADVRLVARSGMSGAGGAPNGPAPAPLRRFRCLRGTVGRGHRLTLVFPTKALRRLGGSL